MCRDDNIADSTLRSHTRGEYFTVNYYLPPPPITIILNIIIIPHDHDPHEILSFF